MATKQTPPVEETTTELIVEETLEQETPIEVTVEEDLLDEPDFIEFEPDDEPLVEETPVEELTTSPIRPINKRVLHLTHNDLDGVSCSVLVQKLFTEVDTEICTYADINKRMEKFLNKHIGNNNKIIKKPKYDLILITDIYLEDTTANLLNEFSEKSGIELLMLDHHSDTNHNPYDWAIVFNIIEGVKTSGTSMVFDYFIKDTTLFSPEELILIGEFVELVRLYDTWDWAIDNNLDAKRLSDYLYVVGEEDFIERFVTDISANFDIKETAIMKTETKRINRYITEKESQMMIVNIDGYVTGVVYAEHSQSIIGNEISSRHPEIDMVAIIDISRKKVSLRTVKDNIHVGLFSERFFNGGGHAKAGGFELQDNVSFQFFNLIIASNKGE